MDKRCRVMAFSLAFLLVGGGLIVAGPGKGDQSKRQVTSKLVTASPFELNSPVTQQNHMQVCVSGFEEGNFVAIGVPWVGYPESHSILTFSGTVDASGGFCVDAPPGWTEMFLQPGTYTIITRWARNGSSDTRSGPSTTFTVMGN